MGELKQHPLPMTIDEQIENLKSLGLIIENEEYAKKILNDISYFRLIKAYSLGFKPKNGKYEEGVTFEQIVELYLFNANFRQVTFAEIEKIEVMSDAELQIILRKFMEFLDIWNPKILWTKNIIGHLWLISKRRFGETQRRRL
jgi:abortive infection bacteriophage resistance protein